MNTAIGTSSPCFMMIEKTNRTLGTMREGRANRKELHTVPMSASSPCVPLKNDTKGIKTMGRQSRSQLQSNICAENREVPWDSPAWRRKNLVFKVLVAAVKGRRGRFVAASQHLRPKDMRRIILQENWNGQRKHFST